MNIKYIILGFIISCASYRVASCVQTKRTINYQNKEFQELVRITYRHGYQMGAYRQDTVLLSLDSAKYFNAVYATTGR